MPNQGKLATLDDKAALAEIASGVFSKQIAARYGVTPYAVRLRLSKYPEYKQAVAEQAESIAESATAEVMTLKKGDDALAIARARVKADTAFKWAAARDAARWGNQQVMQLGAGVVINIGIQRENVVRNVVTPDALPDNSEKNQ